MLVLTLRPGESILAHGEFELLFAGNDEFHNPRFELSVLTDRSYVFGMPGGALTARVASQFEPESFIGQYGGYMRVGDTVVKFHVRSRERIKFVIESPVSIRFSRPAKHGGSLVAR